MKVLPYPSAIHSSLLHNTTCHDSSPLKAWQQLTLLPLSFGTRPWRRPTITTSSVITIKPECPFELLSERIAMGGGDLTLMILHFYNIAPGFGTGEVSEVFV